MSKFIVSYDEVEIEFYSLEDCNNWYQDDVWRGEETYVTETEPPSVLEDGREDGQVAHYEWDGVEFVESAWSKKNRHIYQKVLASEESSGRRSKTVT